MEDMKEVVICRHCGRPEYYGEMHWLSGWRGCRSCYIVRWQDINHKLYIWSDLDGPRPTMEDYKAQLEAENEEDM